MEVKRLKEVESDRFVFVFVLSRRSYVIAHSPSHGAFFRRGSGLIRLTFDAEIHDVISANGAIIHDDVPRPQCHGVPFFHFKAFALARGRIGCCRSTGHVGFVGVHRGRIS